MTLRVTLALESAREAADHLQAAAVLGHVAFVPAADFGFSAALDYLGAAAHQGGRQPDRRVASWIAAVESEIRANAGSNAASLAAIDRALESLAAPGLTADLPWFDYYDATRLSGFAGYAELRAQKFEESRTFSAMFGAVIARGGDYREVFQHFRHGFDLAADRQARLDAGLGEFVNGHDLYPDARSCLRDLKAAGLFAGIAGNQTSRAGRFLRELNLPCDVLATSGDWGAEKPRTAFFDKLAAVSGHGRDEIAYVGDRLDNDIAPAAGAGLFTVWIRRGPWGYVLRPEEPFIEPLLPPGAPSMTVASLAELTARLTGGESG